MAPEITDEMRSAVLAEQAAKCAHVYDMYNLLAPSGADANGIPISVVAARDEGLLPHIRCSMCNRVWVVCPTPGDTYDQAVQAMHDHTDGTWPAAEDTPTG